MLGDAESYCLSTLLSIYTGMNNVVFLSEVQDYFSTMNASMKRKPADFSNLPSYLCILLKVMNDHLEHL